MILRQAPGAVIQFVTTRSGQGRRYLTTAEKGDLLAEVFLWRSTLPTISRRALKLHLVLRAHPARVANVDNSNAAHLAKGNGLARSLVMLVADAEWAS